MTLEMVSMVNCNKINTKKWATLLGGFLINFCIGVPFLFGNLITYVTAFMHYEGFYNESDIGSDVWILGMFNGSLFVTMLISGLLVKRFGYRVTLGISNIIFTSGYLLSYASIHHSMWATILAYGLICGFGAGIGYVTTLDLISKWFPDHVATVSAVLIAGFSTGGTVFNSIVSIYVNPDNLSPQEHLGSLRVFNQTELLDRVPDTFLLLGGIVFLLQLIGTIISFTPLAVTYEDFQNENEPGSSRGEVSIGETSPMELFKDPGSYILWIVVFTSLTVLMGIQSIYKSFGQTFIHDDHFLATLGATASILSAVFKISIAYFADMTSTKIVLILNMCVSVILTFSLYQTHNLPRGWFFFWICALYCVLSSVLVLSPSIIRATWGVSYFSTNFAIIWTAVSLSGIGGPLVINILLKMVGWRNILYIFGAFTAIAFLFSFCIKLPFCPHRKRKSVSSDLQMEHSKER